MRHWNVEMDFTFNVSQLYIDNHNMRFSHLIPDWNANSSVTGESTGQENK